MVTRFKFGHCGGGGYYDWRTEREDEQRKENGYPSSQRKKFNGRLEHNLCMTYSRRFQFNGGQLWSLERYASIYTKLCAEHWFHGPPDDMMIWNRYGDDALLKSLLAVFISVVEIIAMHICIVGLNQTTPDFLLSHRCWERAIPGDVFVHQPAADEIEILTWSAETVSQSWSSTWHYWNHA